MAKPVNTNDISAFEKALRGVLRPLVRALIAKGVTAPAFYRILKQTYVDVSVDTLGDDVTDSRVSVITGVHRRDVKEMRGLRDTGAADVRRKVSTLSTVIGRWLGGDETTDAAGQPLPLARSGASGPTFEALVQSISRDIRPRTVLDEMLRQDLVSIDNDGCVGLNVDALVGPSDIDQRVHFFAHNVGDHMNAAVENLLGDKPKHLERAVFYNHLSAASIANIEAEARRVSNDALMGINKMARALQDKDLTAQEGAHRFRYGVFFFQEDEDEAATKRDTQ